jgi:serine/threonine protein kinase
MGGGQAVTQQTDRLNAALTGRYTIERELGAGGMATVYLAEGIATRCKRAPTHPPCTPFVVRRTRNAQELGGPRANIAYH